MSDDTAATHGATHGAWTPEGEAPPATPKLEEDAVISMLKTVFDPEIPVDIFELGLIYAVEIADDGKVKIEMTLTTPSCPSAQELPSQVEEAVRMAPGVTDVEVEVVWDPPWDQSRMSEDARLALNMY
ncbi:SUF system Fe-S cluster assembly protein [Roseicella sp. DB1501]|uniref:SUF system Fe-S cluster assembly protein n=1 Tax=Roseicella sp. DB1501 TaxID=2730925 RepID=UPI001493193D|nr:SUF system Fe-S cluster assembly protein [Roseicella sp. DB1501]